MRERFGQPIEGIEKERDRQAERQTETEKERGEKRRMVVERRVYTG